MKKSKRDMTPEQWQAHLASKNPRVLPWDTPMVFEQVCGFQQWRSAMCNSRFYQLEGPLSKEHVREFKEDFGVHTEEEYQSKVAELEEESRVAMCAWPMNAAEMKAREDDELAGFE